MDRISNRVMIKQPAFKPHAFFLICLSIFILSCLLRLTKLGSVPAGLYWDETAMYLDAKTISETGKDMHGHSMFQAIFPSYGDYKLPVYIWLASLSFKLIGMSDFSLRLPSAIAGITQGFLIFLLLKEVAKTFTSQKAGKMMAVAGWFILSISPWSILFSRTGFEGHVGQALVTASVLCLFLSRKSRKWLVLATLFGVFAVYSYYSVRFVWPVLLIMYWLCFELETFFPLKIKSVVFWKKLTPSVLSFLVSLVCWAVLLLPLIRSPYYAASQQFRLSTESLLDLTPYSIQSNVDRELSGNTPISRIFYHQRVLQIRDMLSQFADHFDLNYIFLTGDKNLRHGTGLHGLFLFFTLPLLLAGIAFLIQRKPTLLIFILSWWLIALLPASIPLDTPHALRSLNALAPMVVLMAIGGFPIVQSIQHVKQKKIQHAVYVLIVLIIIHNISYFALDYFFIYPAKSASDWQEGYKQVVEVISPEEDRQDKMWIAITDDRFFLWYLAYGPMQSEKIQTLLKDTFILDGINGEQIKFRPFLWGNFEANARPFLVVTPYGKLEKKPEREKIIYSVSGKPIYSVGFYDLL